MTTEREFREGKEPRRRSSGKARANYRPVPKKAHKASSGWLWLAVCGGIAAAMTVNRFPVVERSPLPTVISAVRSAPRVAPAVQTAGTRTLSDRDYAVIDRAAQALNYSGTSVQELANRLAAQAPTESDKARIIYSWLAYNIAYDVPAYESGNYGDVSPDAVMRTRTTVCSGYANLYGAIAQVMGLQAEVLIGFGKGNGYLVGKDGKANHAWNGVKINGNWYLLDATWGAGTVNNGQFNRRFNSHYFATPPEQFIYDHFPEQEDWQLLPSRYSKAQFDNLPEVFSAFFQQRLYLASHRERHIQAGQTVQIQINAPNNVIATAQLRSQGQDLSRSYTLVQQRNGQITINVTFPEAGEYELRIFAKDRQQAGLYPSVVSYQITASQSGVEFPETYSSFTEKDVFLSSPLTRSLPSEVAVPFSLIVPHAEEVKVVDRSTGQWTDLTRSGSQFMGNVVTSGGNVVVLAKFPGSDRYVGLLSYD